MIFLITKNINTREELNVRLGSEFDFNIISSIDILKGVRFKGKVLLVLEEVLFIVKLILILALKNHKQSTFNIVCDSHHYSILLFGKIMLLLGKKSRIYMFNFYIHGLGENIYVKKILKYLLSQKAGILTQSKTEVNYFRELSPILNVHFFPYCQGQITDRSTDCNTLGDYIFSGGYTNRDYNMLLRCAANMPDQKFIIVCSRLNKLSEVVPENVEIQKEIPSQEFHRLMAGSRAVVIPLAENVGSSGQMVALAGMQLNKTVIYPNFEVVSQYFEDKKNGIMYRAGDINSLTDKLRFVASDKNNRQLHAIGIAAKARWHACFRRENFLRALCEHLTDYFTNVSDEYHVI